MEIIITESKSVGPDDFHPKFLKETAYLISKPLEIIFKENTLPEIWKIGDITPIHKKESKENVANYRPISLTSIICRAMEKIIKDIVILHMESNSLFSNQQHGFRKGNSCTSQLIEVMDDWISKLDGNDNIDVIYMDFQNAFDGVPHERLLKKLHSYGIQGNLIGWIRNFLTNRKQRVILNGTQSSTAIVTSGIPQGSVLGPVLFTIYINDLPDLVHNTTKLFADDAKIYSVVNNANDQDDLQNDLKQLDKWSRHWLLKFNPEM